MIDKVIFEKHVIKKDGMLIPNKSGNINIIATFHWCGYINNPDSWYLDLNKCTLTTPGWSINIKRTPNWSSGEYYTHSNHLIKSLSEIERLFEQECNAFLEDKINKWILS